MSDTSRRKFLAAAGAGTAAGAAGAAGVFGGGAAEAATTTKRHKGASTEPVVAFVEDPSSDVVHLMVGDREVVVKDRELAARILNAAGRK